MSQGIDTTSAADQSGAARVPDDVRIGLAFSGGGYRAAMFDLGTLSFLNSVKIDEKRTLLDCVVALSSVSGGTIPAMKYMLARARNEDIDAMIKELFEFLCNEDLVTHALDGLSKEKANPEVSAIKLMAEIYDKHLFGGATLGEIMDKIKSSTFPVKDYTALATDFESSLPFRFRIYDDSIGATCVFGNNGHRINISDARNITLGEALACSSCFPSGFEPMMFPDDFKFYSQLNNKNKYKKQVEKTEGEQEWHGFGIMDGGVADNQGIESILLAEERLHSHFSKKGSSNKAFDLVIISDVSSPDMKSKYEPHKEMLPKWLGKLTIGRLRNYGLISEAVMLVLFILSLVAGSGFWTGVTSVILAIVTLANVAGIWSKQKMFQAIGKTFVGDRARFISHLKFSTLESLLMNRATSVITMSSEVFLKRLRQLAYGSIYNDKAWTNRVFSTTVYELKPKKIESRVNNSLPRHLVPTEAMQQNSEKAASMDTTLWFTAEEKAAGMPQAIMAAGQYTACFNLLDHIDQIRKDKTNVSSALNNLLTSLEPQLLEAWEKFKSEDPQYGPQWMVPKR